MEHHRQEKIELIKKSFEFKNQKRYKEAIEMLHKVLEYENRPEDNIEILSQLGDLHLLLKNYDRALDHYQKVLNLNKFHQHSYQKSFEIHIETNQLNKALNLANKMCEDVKTPQSYYNYLKALIKLEKQQDAIEIFNNLDESIKLDVNILHLIATISHQEKKELILKKILELDETHYGANIELAKIEFDKGNYDKVITYCLNLDEDTPISLYYLAKIETHRQNYTRAIELFIKAIELDNEEHDFYIDLAKAYIDICWFNEALIMLKKSINLSVSKNNSKDLDEKQFLTGWILIKQNEIQKALLNLNSINKNSNYYSKAQILIQAINVKNSNISEALSKLEEYFNSEKENPILLDTLALAYKELNLYSKAIQVYKEALKIFPESIYYNLELIDLLIDNKEYDNAIEIINNIKKKCSNCPAIYNSLARIYFRLKNYAKALESINEYLKLDFNNAESHYFKGLILNNLEEYSQAKEAIYTAIKLNPTSAKYYSQMATSYCGLKEYENAILYSKEAIEIDQNEINYKKQAYEISCLIGNKEQIQLFKKQLERTEKILKLNR